MTSKERMLKAMRNQQPDRVPVAPDMSNMIPCRLTGKPFWDIYLYQNPPRWKAYIDAVKHFGTDGWLDNLDGFSPDEPRAPQPGPRDETTETVIVEKTDARIVTRSYTQKKGHGKAWSPYVTVYPRWDPPSHVLASKMDLHREPDTYWPIEGVTPQKQGFDLLREARTLFGDKGVIGAYVFPPALGNPEGGGYSVYDYYDKYDEVKAWSVRCTQDTVNHLKRILAGPVKPDFILTGGSGMLVFNTPDIIRDLSLPALKEITRLCKEAGMPSQIHCCGPERELIKLCAEETDLCSINPLEIAPMGNCDLGEIKQSFGRSLGLMGNLHTTDVMLRGTAQDVRRESLKAIRAAGENGGFILSTGDQCGRDTPEENIHAMVAVAQEFGVYPLNLKAIDREIAALEQ